MTLMNGEKSEEELTCRFKIDMRNLTNFDLRTQKSLKIYTLMGCFWSKYIMLGLKKYRGAAFHDTRVWCKIWRETDLWFGKWHEEFGKFWPEHTKFSKLELSLDPFIQSRKCMSLKQGVMRYDNEEWCNIWSRTDLPFQNWNEECNKSWPKQSKISKIFFLMGWFSPKCIMFEL